MKKLFALVYSAVVLIFAPTLPCLAQQHLAVTDLARIPELEPPAAILPRPPAAPKAGHHRWLTLNNASVAFLLASEAIDSLTTYNNLTHPRWICGYSTAFGNAVTYISNDGHRYDPRTIQHDLCGPGPSGQLANYAYDVTRTGAYTETGWVTSLGFTGRRNPAGVIAWNVADDVGQMLVEKYLSRKRNYLGRVAPAINFARGLVHLDCGIQNVQFARHHGNSTTWTFNLPNETTLYPGPRWWGRP